MSAELQGLRDRIRDEGVEATAFPYFIIVERVQHNNLLLIAGVWFSREAATAHLEGRRYEYGDKAFVWCASGHASVDWRGLLEQPEAPALEAAPAKP